RTFASPVRVSEDQWVLEGCPDDGPSMGVDRTGRIHLVWPTLGKEAPASGGEPVETTALFYSTSADGRTFGKRQRIPTEGLPHHPRIAVGADGSPPAVGDELAKGTRRVATGRSAPATNGVSSF